MTALIFLRNIDGTDHEFDFLEALRHTCAHNFVLPDDPRFEELEAARDTLLANDAALAQLLVVNQRAEDSYRAQHAKEETKIIAQLASMRLPDIIVKP